MKRLWSDPFLLIAALGCTLLPTVEATPFHKDWSAIYPYINSTINGGSAWSGALTNPYSLKVDGLGDVYVGTTRSSSAPYSAQMLLLKYRRCDGTLLWSKTYPLTIAGTDTYLAGIDIDPAGNICVAGWFELPGLRQSQWITLKYASANGALLWGPKIFGTLDPKTQPRAVAADKNGNVLVTGIDVVAGIPQISLVKYDGFSGTQISSGAAPTAPADMMPSHRQGGGPVLALDLKGNAIVTGWLPISSSSAHCQTIKFQSSGTATAIASDVAGPYVGSGQQFGHAVALNAAKTLIYVLGLDGLNSKWTILSYKNLPGLPPNPAWVIQSFGPNAINMPSSIAVDSQGKVVATGYTGSLTVHDYLTAKWGPSGGAPTWFVTTAVAPFVSVYDSLEASALQVDGQNSIYVSGKGRRIAAGLGFGTTDFVTLRYSPLGALDWWDPHNYALGASSYEDGAVAMTLDAATNVYVTGSSALYSTATFGLLDAQVDTVKYNQGPQANDNCSQAQLLPASTPRTVAFNTYFATPSGVGSGCGAGAKDVWYKWKAPCPGTVDIDTCGSCFNTVLTVYDGGTSANCPNGANPGSLISCNDDAGFNGRCSGGLQSYVQFQALANHTYFIQVSGATAADFGDGRLTILGPNPLAPTCPPVCCDFCPPRKFRLTGSANGSNWRWSLSVPCCMNIEGTAGNPWIGGGSPGPLLAGDTAEKLAKYFMNSITNACANTVPTIGNLVGKSVNATVQHIAGSPAEDFLSISVRPCCLQDCTPFVFRVGLAATPFDQLCLVPNITVLPTLSTAPPASALGGCQFNPYIEEVPLTAADIDANGVSDDTDIATGHSQDLDLDGVPDEFQSSTPTLLSATAICASNTVTVSFSETLDGDTAADAANYQLSGGLAIQAATLESDGHTVRLSTAPLDGGVSYILTVTNVRNLIGNLIEPDSQVSFTCTTNSVDPGRLFLITTNTIWRYLDDGSDQGTAWREPAFDDSAWSNGLALFGLETSVPYPYPQPIQTPLPIGDDLVTYYFRTHFAWNDNLTGVVLTTTNFIDDGAVFYLNGVEAGRLRMTNSPVLFTSLALDQGAEGQPETLILSSASLLSGDNVLAVEVHQTTLPNSDIVFGLTLEARPDEGPPAAAIAFIEGDVVISSTRIGILEEANQLLGALTAWTPIATATNAYRLTPTNGQRFYRVRVP